MSRLSTFFASSSAKFSAAFRENPSARRPGARLADCLVFVMLAVLLMAGPCAAQQDHRQNEPGKFDFYVLALSWAPTFCDAAVVRAGGEALPAECAARAVPFVVHGLWPEYAVGFPEFCQQPTPRLDRNVVASMLDLMPAAGLIFTEWDKHGTCSGLSARAYFTAIRKARALVKIPEEFIEPADEVTLSPEAIAEAFVDANPGASRASFAIGCDAKRLTEVRVCLGKDLRFHDCGGDIGQRSCRRDQIVMPPLHNSERKAAAVER
jgi:ribonuclease T2